MRIQTLCSSDRLLAGCHDNATTGSSGPKRHSDVLATSRSVHSLVDGEVMRRVCASRVAIPDKSRSEFARMAVARETAFTAEIRQREAPGTIDRLWRRLECILVWNGFGEFEVSTMRMIAVAECRRCCWVARQCR